MEINYMKFMHFDPIKGIKELSDDILFRLDDNQSYDDVINRLGYT